MAVPETPAASAAPTRAPRRVAESALTALPWLVVLALLPIAWWRVGVGVHDIVGYVAYWLGALVLPGTLVHRALRGSRGNLPEDLGFGAATGLVLELAAWALATATGQQHLLRWWAAPVVLLFLAVPRLRRHWRIGRRQPLPLAWHVAMAAVLLAVLAWAAVQWPGNPVPPTADHTYYPDLFYHLSLVQELTRDMPFVLPHVAGEPLRYHFLSDAHMASASMITGSSPALVLLRLWLVPVAATAVLVSAGVARDLSRVWWTGPIVAAVTYIGLPVALGSALTDAAGVLSVASPSQTYVLALFVVLVGLCLDAVRGRALGPGWALVPAFGLACAGSKSSALPGLLAGLLVTAVVTVWRRRRVPWPTVVALALLLAATAVGYRLFAGGGAGTLRVQVFGLLRFMLPYGQTFGGSDGTRAGGLAPPGLASGGWPAGLFACGILGWWLLMQAPRLAGTLLLLSRRHRADPATWLLAGTVLAGAGATWVFHHPSASQVYFWLAVLPIGVLLSGHLLAATRPRWPVLVVGALAGAVVALTIPAAGLPAASLGGWWGALGWSAGRFLALALLAGVLGVLVAVLLRRYSGELRWTAAAVAAVTAAIFGASVAVGAKGTVLAALRLRDSESAVAGLPPTPTDTRYVLTRAEARAALWLDAHADADDVVATNVHCRPARTTPHCDARAFWVTGLGGHRAVVESWGYTDAALAAHGRYGLGYARQDPPDAELFALNERVFTTPSGADLDRLRREYGVRWLFADTRAGRVSPALAELAPIRLVSGPVIIYELP
ncbi:hypothetical protein GCM10009848_14860 [Micromonospora lupini]